MSNRKQIADVFDAFSAALRDVSDGDLDAVVAGRATLKIVVTRAPNGKTRKDISQKGADVAPIDTDAILASMGTAETREDGVRIVEDMSLNRGELEALARHLSIPVMREDNKVTLVTKIVEATVGSRLRSVAIRNPSAA